MAPEINLRLSFQAPTPYGGVNTARATAVTAPVHHSLPFPCLRYPGNQILIPMKEKCAVDFPLCVHAPNSRVNC